MATTQSSGNSSHQLFLPPQPPVRQLPKGGRRRRKPKSPHPAQGFKLLELPWEIRQAILRDLLWQPDPILFSSNHSNFKGPEGVLTVDDPECKEYWRNVRQREADDPNGSDQQTQSICPSRKFYPEVLAVCKQLYEEGAPILYDNTVNCRIRCGITSESLSHCGYYITSPPQTSIAILGERYSYTPSSGNRPIIGELSSWFKQMRKAHVEILVNSSDLEDHQVFAEALDSIHSFVKVLRASVWKSLSIDLMIDEGFGHLPSAPGAVYVPENSSSPDYRHNILRPFIYLRDCEVSVTGATFSLISQLKEVMTSSAGDCPVNDLDEMFEDIRSYVDSIVGTKEESRWDEVTHDQDFSMKKIWELVEDLDTWRLYVDTEQFLNDRLLIVLELSRFLLSQRDHMSASDPDGTSHRPRGAGLTLDEVDQQWRLLTMDYSDLFAGPLSKLAAPDISLVS